MPFRRFVLNAANFNGALSLLLDTIQSISDVQHTNKVITNTLRLCNSKCPRLRFYMAHSLLRVRITRRPWDEQRYRVARRAPLTVRVVTIAKSTYACAARSLYRSATPREFRLAFSQRSLHGTLPVFLSASVRLCSPMCSALHVSASTPSRSSRGITTQVLAFQFSMSWMPQAFEIGYSANFAASPCAGS